MLKGKQFRMTRQRQTIMEELGNMESHPSADEVYMLVRRRLPHISLGTVYRNLEMLVKRGMVKKLEVGGHQTRFDGRLEEHYHIRCIGCGRVEDVRVEPMVELEEKLRLVTRYKILGHRVEYYGLCPRCNRKRTVSESSGIEGRRGKNETTRNKD